MTDLMPGYAAPQAQRSDATPLLNSRSPVARAMEKLHRCDSMAFPGDFIAASEASEGISGRCSAVFLRVGESPWWMRVTMVVIHMLFVGVLFLLDTDFMWRHEPWYSGLYVILLGATLVQYFFTSGSSPGYVIDAKRAVNGLKMDITYSKPQTVLKNGNSIASHNQGQVGHMQVNSSPWLKLVIDLYPPEMASRNLNCHYCNIVQPPRSKHCHDCDKCVLQFDHHCLWLRTCIGQRNHCRFWWYVFAETLLCTWTVLLYAVFLHSEVSRAQWKNFIVIALLVPLVCCLIFFILLLLLHSYLALTNQTTYEMVRRRRISYMRGIPNRVHPFSNGVFRNLDAFCCSRLGACDVEAVPTLEELEVKARPYSCRDVVSCRCC